MSSKLDELLTLFKTKLQGFEQLDRYKDQTNILESYIQLSVSNLELLLNLNVDNQEFLQTRKWDDLIVQGAVLQYLNNKILEDFNWTPKTIDSNCLSFYQTELNDYNTKITTIGNRLGLNKSVDCFSEFLKPIAICNG